MAKEQPISLMVAVWLMGMVFLSGCNENIKSAVCNDGVVTPPETCDTAIADGQPGACPKSCNSGKACAIDILWNSNTCLAICTQKILDNCCGNLVVEAKETCDTGIPAGQVGACPTSCDDGNACTTDKLENADSCTAACIHTPIEACSGNIKDGCCPDGCSYESGDKYDIDCSATCGNGTVDDGETCDPPSLCPASCDDGDACTIDTMTGSAANCNAACSHQAITACSGNIKDGCCPAGCSPTSDSDCSVSCGNGVVDAGETCDKAILAGKPGACPTSCDDGDICTINTATGSAANCNVACSHQDITECRDGDGCCPKNCNANNDANCAPVCGNGVVEAGEQCDRPNGSTCCDGCQSDVLTGTWIARITTIGTIDESPPFTSPFTGATIDFVQRLHITKSGGMLNAQFDICSLSASTPSDCMSPVYTCAALPFSMTYTPAVLATFTTSGSIADQCVLAGDGVTFPPFTITSGWGGVVPTTNTCPAPPSNITYPYPPGTLPTECSGAVDSDGDGVYGITIPICLITMIYYNEFDGLDITAELNGMKLTNATTNTGAINFNIEGYKFSAIFGPGLLSIIPDNNPIPVTFIKLDGDVSCAVVLADHCPEGEACHQ